MSEKLFDLAAEYDEMLNQGLRLSGENKSYFVRGRIAALQKALPGDFSPKHILDFGCGTGDTTQYLAEQFPDARVMGCDSAENALAFARRQNKLERVDFCEPDDLETAEPFDLCYVNGVFHHISPDRRIHALEAIKNVLMEEAFIGFFENNPWNVGTRLIMNRIPFDRDAQMLTPIDSRRLIRDCKLTPIDLQFLFFFPRQLSFVRILEPYFLRVPLGAQYFILIANGQ